MTSLPALRLVAKPPGNSASRSVGRARAGRSLQLLCQKLALVVAASPQKPARDRGHLRCPPLDLGFRGLTAAKTARVRLGGPSSSGGAVHAVSVPPAGAARAIRGRSHSSRSVAVNPVDD